MRIISVVACVAFFASNGSALAADCSKGMLWPFVRTAGDCLTDAEIAGGQRGVYSGPVNNNVDVGAIKPSEVPAQSSGVSGGGSTGGGENGALIPTSVFGASGPAPRAQIACHKGILWPFNREPGDCLTETEKKDGKTGVYDSAGLTQVNATPGALSATPPSPPVAKCERSWLWPFVRESNDCPTEADKKDGKSAGNGNAPATAQISAVAAPAPSAQIAAPTPAQAPAPVVSAPQPAQAQAAATCERGWFWPFVRESNDCLTEADKKNGKVFTPAPAPAMTQMSAVSAAPTQAQTQTVAAPAPAPAAATCQKGLLWPFVREAKDCPTEADKKNGK
jgi:hypothetical protein